MSDEKHPDSGAAVLALLARIEAAFDITAKHVEMTVQGIQRNLDLLQGQIGTISRRVGSLEERVGRLEHPKGNEPADTRERIERALDDIKSALDEAATKATTKEP